MKSHLNRTIKRPTGIAAIAVLIATMFAGSAIGQPGQTPPQVKQVPAYIDDLGDPNPRVREKAADVLGIIGLDIKDETVLLPAVARLVALMITMLGRSSAARDAVLARMIASPAYRIALRKSSIVKLQSNST